MKKSVKITVIVICSLLIVLACYCCVVSFIDYDVYAQREQSHNKAEEYINSEEYVFDRTMQGARFSQFFYAIEAVLCAVSIITYAIFKERLEKIVDNPNYYTRKIIDKKLLKAEMPLEIVGILLLAVFYCILQFVQVSFGVVLLFMIFSVIFTLPALIFLVNILAVTNKNETAPMIGTQNQPKL